MEYLFIAIFAQTLIVLFLFKEDLIKKGAEKFIWFCLINSACILLLKFVFLITKEQKLYTSFSPSILLITPVLIYLYIKSVLADKVIPKKKQILHYLPTIIFSIAFTAISINIFIYKDYSWITPYKKSYDIVSFIVNIAYNSIGLYLIVKTKKESLKWLFYPLILFISGVIVLYTGKTAAIPYLVPIGLITSLIGLIVFLALFLRGRESNKSQKIKEETDSSKTPKYEKSSLKTEQKEEILKTLEKCMATKKPYLNPNLSLTDLSNSLNISKHNITEVLNIDLEKNFFLYINEYRIKEAKKRMLEHKKDNLLLIAHFSGFKSKTTFIKYFKEIVGLTPSEYRKQQEL